MESRRRVRSRSSAVPVKSARFSLLGRQVFSTKPPEFTDTNSDTEPPAWLPLETGTSISPRTMEKTENLIPISVFTATQAHCPLPLKKQNKSFQHQALWFKNRSPCARSAAHGFFIAAKRTRYSLRDSFLSFIQFSIKIFDSLNEQLIS